MTKSSTSNLLFTILIFLNPTGQPACLEEYFRRWFDLYQNDLSPRPRLSPLRTSLCCFPPSLPLLLSLTYLHLSSQVTNCPTSPLDPQRRNPFLTPLPPLLVSLNTPRMTCSGFLRPFWRIELPLPLPPQLQPSPKYPGRSWSPVSRTYTAESPT